MLSIILAFIGAAGAWFGIYFGCEGNHWGWATLAAFAAFIAVSIIINLLIRKRMEAIFNRVQSHIINSQDSIRKRVQSMQMKIQNQQKLMEFAEKEQSTSVRQAIDMLEDLKPFQKWNIMVNKQVNTLKGQLFYQIKDFAEADKFLDKAFVADPMIIAMQMARMYKNDNLKDLEKTFRKGLARFKYEKALILYAVYSWILVKQEKIDEAIEILNEGKDKTESPVLKQNWENLVNGRTKRFSNAGIGDIWFGLYLENPPIVRQQQQMPFGGRGGFRH